MDGSQDRRFVSSRGLVSPIYRLAPSETHHWDRDEAIRRTRLYLRRIAAGVGADETARRLRAHPARDLDEAARLTRLALEVETAPVRHVAGTM